MKAQNNLRAVICGIAIVPTDSMTMGPHIGIDTTVITANGITIEFNRVQSASFSEKRSESGDFINQEFDSVFTDTSGTATLDHRQLADTDAIILIKYSNGDVRVIGTDLAPVRCEVEEAGSPRTFRVSFRRKSPEFSKFVQSLQ